MPDFTLASEFTSAKSLEEINAKIERLNVVPGWGRSGHPGAPEPSSPYKTYHWRYAECRAALETAARFISAEAAGRRILNFRNPIPDNKLGATRTMLHAYQLVLPGETAPAHRHTAHALRVILDGKKMYSIVNGEKTPMETGDVVLTPGGAWHSHEHNGDETACWIDGLDVPLVSALQLMTWEPHPDRYEQTVTTVETSPFRFTAADIARRLDGAKTDPEGIYGKRVRLEAPSMPTLGIYVQRHDGGVTTQRYRTNANVTFAVMAGHGTSVIEGEEIHWQHGDIFVAPSWRWIEHKPAVDAQLFSMTDAPLLEWARYLRFERA